jgi:hypothetical protein
MTVLPSDLVVYGSANMPEADSATVGGAVDFTKRVLFTDVSPSGTIDMVSSSGSDTGTLLTLAGRDSSTLNVITQTTSLNGTTPVTGGQSYDRLLYAVITGGAIGPLTSPGGSAAVGDVALYAHTAVISAHTAQTGAANASGGTPALFKLQSGDGSSVAIGQIIRIKTNTGASQLRRIVATGGYGTDVVAVNRDWGTLPDNTSTYDVYQGMLFEIAPNAVLAITRCFATADAAVPGGSTRIFYEKVFAVNNNTASALTEASLRIGSDTPALPAGSLLDMALCTGLNDTHTSTDRKTAPASGAGSFITQPASINVAGGSLTSGVAPNSAGAQGIWLRLTLPAGAAVYKGALNLRIAGSTS